MSTQTIQTRVAFVRDTTTFALFNESAKRWVCYPAYTKLRTEADSCNRFAAMERYRQLTGGRFTNYNTAAPLVPAFELRWFLVAVGSVAASENFVAEVICTRDELRDQLAAISECNGDAPVIAIEVFTGETRATLFNPQREVVWGERYINDAARALSHHQTTGEAYGPRAGRMQLNTNTATK